MITETTENINIFIDIQEEFKRGLFKKAHFYIIKLNWRGETHLLVMIKWSLLVKPPGLVEIGPMVLKGNIYKRG